MKETTTLSPESIFSRLGQDPSPGSGLRPQADSGNTLDHLAIRAGPFSFP